jgi:polyphosphate kinase 2 (PPK2 family)
MGFCTDEEYEVFMEMAPTFEAMLLRSDIKMIKYYLDITKDEQKKRLEDRKTDPLKQWKISPIDEAALKHWDDYTKARDAMFERTSQPHSPWVVVKADDKRAARCNVIRDILSRIDPDHNGEHPDPSVVFEFDTAALNDGRLAR